METRQSKRGVRQNRQMYREPRWNVALIENFPLIFNDTVKTKALGDRVEHRGLLKFVTVFPITWLNSLATRSSGAQHQSLAPLPHVNRSAVVTILWL